jgi:D-alanyl-D-alanine carboxypeptidase
MQPRPSLTIALLLVLGLVAAAESALDQPAGQWVCPPCGHADDNHLYDAPGTCPICGMPLVPIEGAEVPILPGTRLDAAMERAISRGLVGATVLVEELASGRRWVRAAGIRDFERRSAVQAGDRFRLASITKAFTAAAVLRLSDMGRLNLEDRIAEHLDAELLGELANFEGVTIRQLLTHSAGMADFSTGPEFTRAIFAGRGLWRNLSPTELLAFAAGKPPLSQPVAPGEGAYYSNTHYFLLGLLIEKITGRPYADSIHDLVAGPLGLESVGFEGGTQGSGIVVSSFTVPDSGGPIREAMRAKGRGPIRDDGLVDLSQLYESYNYWAFAAGGLLCNVADLAEFTHQVLGDFLSPDSRDLFVRVFTTGRSTGGTYFGFGGGADGISTILLMVNNEWLIVVLANTTGIPGISATEIIREVLP